MPVVSIYQPLADYLARKEGDIWDASFAEVERILRRSLPQSAYQHQAWWANQNGPGRSQTQGWRSVGWKTAKLDLEGKRIRFERDRLQGRDIRRKLGPDTSAGDDLFEQAARLTGIVDRKELVTAGLRALIQRETANCLITLGGTMPDYLPGSRERPDC
jgi:hypothetical protein